MDRHSLGTGSHVQENHLEGCSTSGPGPTPLVSDSVGPGICISNKFPGGGDGSIAAAALLGTTL